MGDGRHANPGVAPFSMPLLIARPLTAARGRNQTGGATGLQVPCLLTTADYTFGPVYTTSHRMWSGDANMI